MATVTLQNVKKSFGATDVIHGVDVDIKDGEFIVIVGPSGCGKSTLLRMVAGLETVSSGDILIGGDRANDKEPMDRDIAMVFQNYALYPHMSVRQNMGYGLKIAKMPATEIDAKVQEAARLLQLFEKLEDLRLNGHVQGCGWLIGNQKLRFIGKGHGDHHPLPLPAGKLVRIGFEPFFRVPYAHIIEKLEHRVTERLAGEAAMQLQPFGDLLLNGVERVERGHRLLENH